MMSPSSLHAASAYRNVAVQTRSANHDPYELVCLLFEGVLECVSNARGAIESQNVVAKVKHIDKAIRLIQEGLRTSLDLDSGGELAANLASLYDYSVLRLTQANAKNDTAALVEVAELFAPLLDGWKHMRSGAVEPEAAAMPAASVQASPAPTPAAPSPQMASPAIPMAARRPLGAYANVAAYGKNSVAMGA